MADEHAEPKKLKLTPMQPDELELEPAGPPDELELEPLETTKLELRPADPE